MQPQLTSSMRATVVTDMTETPSSSWKTAACSTIVNPRLVFKQCGDRSDYFTQKLDMETTYITITSTELHTEDKNMSDFDRGINSIFTSEPIISTESIVHQNQETGTSETAVFDVQSEPSGVLPYNLTEELSLSQSASSILDQVQLCERPMLSLSPDISRMMDDGLNPKSSSLIIPPCVFSMADSILSSERPISPSDFLHNDLEQASQPEMEDIGIPSDLIDQIFKEIPEDIPLDYSEHLDLDLNLFSQFEEPDNKTAAHKCGLLDEVNRKNPIDCAGDLHNSTVSTTVTSPSKIVTNCMEMVQTRETRRNRRKPIRYRATTSSGDLMASSSGTILTRGVKTNRNELSNEEKYIRSRIQNNLASKRCREKRKQNFSKMAMTLDELEKKNKTLQDQVAHLTQLRDNFKDFVNKYLFQRIGKK